MASFVDLPPEMRNNIYNMLLTGPSPDLDVLRVSKSVYEEASSYFYQHRAFTVSIPGSVETNILPPIPDKHLRCLKHLTINILFPASHAQQENCARRIDALASSRTRLAYLTLVLTSTVSRLLSSRVDDTVLTDSHPFVLALRRLLASEAVQLLKVELQGSWFAPGIATALQAEFEGRLEVSTIPLPSGPAAGPAAEVVERELVGCTTNSHLFAMGFDEKEVMDIQASSPSSLSEVLEELDPFSPSEYSVSSGPEDDDAGDPASMRLKRADSFFDEESDVVNHTAGDGEEELTEEDDVGDEEMLDVDDFEAILRNLGGMAEQRGAEREVCYLANFAPEVLGRWVV